jgi:hypothetical protein
VFYIWNVVHRSYLSTPADDHCKVVKKLVFITVFFWNSGRVRSYPYPADHCQRMSHENEITCNIHQGSCVSVGFRWIIPRSPFVIRWKDAAIFDKIQEWISGSQGTDPYLVCVFMSPSFSLCFIIIEMKY